ncbi:restriction endonuclease [Streptomyces sp. NPDC059918]|uniref:restriction endonuclease n=1 Tax=unclassified Streptomyces TaxID=2593676 RepID=UPI0036505EED
MATPEEELPGSVRGMRSTGRDAVLAIGLLAIGIGGLAAFLKAARTAESGLPAAPIAALGISLLGVALAKWSIAPHRRRVRAPGPAAAPTAAYQAPPAALPEVGGGALDHAAADADGFEHTVAALCARDGCTSVEVVGGAGDLGADVLATTAAGLRVVLQCKHYAADNRVGSQDLQRFGGTCFAVHEADIAVLVTTSTFTAPAAEYAATCGIVCVDGDALAAWTEQEEPPPWETGRPGPASEPCEDPARAPSP